MKKGTFSQAVFLVLVLMLAGACATTGLPAVPLPPATEIKISQPGPQTPKELASCLGAWAGRWSFGTEMALIVESIDAKGARVIYTRGVGPDGSQGWWTRSYASVENNSIILRFGNLTRTFTCGGNSIAGTYQREGRPTSGYVTLFKFELPAEPAAPAAAKTAEIDPVAAEKLVASSPFSGTAAFPSGTFEVEFSFSKSNGKLEGRLTRTTSSITSPGPLRSVKVKLGKVTFTTEAGVDYELAFDRDGNLIGSARSGFGPGSVKLSPAKR